MPGARCVVAQRRKVVVALDQRNIACGSGFLLRAGRKCHFPFGRKVRASGSLDKLSASTNGVGRYSNLGTPGTSSAARPLRCTLPCPCMNHCLWSFVSLTLKASILTIWTTTDGCPLSYLTQRNAFLSPHIPRTACPLP